MKSFPATEPFEIISIDILWELHRSPRCNFYIVVITDRSSKLSQTVPLKRTTTEDIAIAFVHYWVFFYQPLNKKLSDNGN